MRRTFAIDVLACPDCGGRLRLVATISDRLNADRLPTVVELLKREAIAIGQKINPFDPLLRRPSQVFGQPG